MKLSAAIKDQKHEIKIERRGAEVFAEIGERRYALEVSEPEPDIFLLKHDHRVYRIYVAPNNLVSVGGSEYEITLTDPKRLSSFAAADGQLDGASEIKTAMPGKVVRILVETGAQIAKGEGVIVVEAMKMQNEMKSPKDGIIREIRFAEGATVNAGDILVVIE